jgi:glycosyltransferase involved in cell wall biosynthesis
MRLGLVIYGSLEQLSGGYLYDRQLVQALRRRGHEVRLIELPDHGYLPNLLSGFIGKPRDFSGLEILLQDELCHTSLIGANRRLRRSGYTGRIVALLHHALSAERRSRWVNRLYRAVERAYFTEVDAVVCTSHATRAALSGLVRPNLPCLVAQPGRDHLGGGLNPELIRRRAQEPGPLQILFLGNLIPRKGLDTLLQGLAELEPASWELTVAGSADRAPAFAGGLRRRADRLGLNGRVHWLGPLSHAELEELLPRMHLLAVPSQHEGFGIAYLDGMAFGLPALASASGGARDLVREPDNGYLIAPGDARTLARRIQQLGEDRGHLAEMGVAAHRTWQAHPTWQETATAFEAYFMNSPADPVEIDLLPEASRSSRS